MGKAIGEYPNNYYYLRRVLAQKIKERLESASQEAPRHYDEFLLDLRIFARDLSLESGAPLRMIYTLFAQRGIILEEKVRS